MGSLFRHGRGVHLGPPEPILPVPDWIKMVAAGTARHGKLCIHWGDAAIPAPKIKLIVL